MQASFLPALRLFLVLTIVTGLLYPLGITAAARLLFPRAAGGSLILRDGRVVGSALLAQSFTNAAFFWPRPSATAFATVPGGASNLGPTSAALRQAVETRARRLRAAHGLPPDALVPPDLLTTSASGLDPHLSPAAIRFQVDRVARARGLDAAGLQRLHQLVDRHLEAPQWGFLGQPRVNVLKLNLALRRLE